VSPVLHPAENGANTAKTTSGHPADRINTLRWSADFLKIGVCAVVLRVDREERSEQIRAWNTLKNCPPDGTLGGAPFRRAPETHCSIRVVSFKFYCAKVNKSATFFRVEFLLNLSLRVEFLLKTDNGHPKDTRVTVFTLATPGNPLRYNTPRSAPPVFALAPSRGPRKRSQSPVSRTRTYRHVWTDPSLS